MSEIKQNNEYCLNCKEKIDYTINVRNRKFCCMSCFDRYYRDRQSPKTKILISLQTRVYNYYFWKGATWLGHIEKYIGCSKGDLFIHIESLFQEGMNWINWGSGGWNIDHIKPCNSFNLLKDEEIKKCFNYSNLQPLWERNNRAKGKEDIQPRITTVNSLWDI